MACRSKVQRLPAPVREFIEAKIAEDRMSLPELLAELHRRFPDEVAGLPSIKGLERYRKALNARLAPIRASTEAARLIAACAGGTSEERTEALTALLQGELYETLLGMKSRPEAEWQARVQSLASAARVVSSLSRGSLDIKEHQARAASGEQERAVKVLPAVLRQVIEAAYDL